MRFAGLYEGSIVVNKLYLTFFKLTISLKKTITEMGVFGGFKTNKTTDHDTRGLSNANFRFQVKFS